MSLAIAQILDGNARQYSRISPFRPSYSGFSEESDKITKHLKDTCDHQRETALGDQKFLSRQKDIEDLVAVYDEANQENWDGYGASPVDARTALHAWAFIREIPENIPSPEISADPDGEIAFEWYRGQDCMFIVSIDASSSLIYIGRFPNGEIMDGKTRFLHRRLPEIILRGIEKVLDEPG